MLKHGYEGVRQIEAHVTNTMGWSATTGQVEPWVYEQISRTFVLDPEMRARLSSAQSSRIRQDDQSHPRSPRARLLESGSPTRSLRSETRETKWKTASKASIAEVA